MLITLEGLDGSGKTTVWEALQSAFPDAIFTREPTNSWYGDAVYRSLSDDNADPLAELFLYTADHADHLSRVIKPALAANQHVISDRYSDSRYAYQAATLADAACSIDDPLAYIQSIHRPFSRPPDTTIYLELDADIAAERAGRTNKFELGPYLNAVQKNYERIIEEEPDRFVSVDATQSPSVVSEEGITIVRSKLH